MTLAAANHGDETRMVRNAGNPPPAGASAFDRTSNDLLQDAAELRQRAAEAAAEAGDQMDSAGARAHRALDRLSSAAGNVGGSFVDGAKGTLKHGLVEGGGNAVLGAGSGTLGGIVWVGEEALTGIAELAEWASEGFASAHNAAEKFHGTGDTVTVREIEGQDSERLSDRLFGFAGDRFERSADGFVAAWGAYGRAIDQAIDAGVDVLHVAKYTGLAAADVIEAAVAQGDADLKYGAAALHDGASWAVQAAESGVEYSAELSQAAAELTADLGNALNGPKDGRQITIREAVARYDQRVQELVQLNPQLAESAPGHPSPGRTASERPGTSEAPRNQTHQIVVRKDDGAIGATLRHWEISGEGMSGREAATLRSRLAELNAEKIPNIDHIEPGWDLTIPGEAEVRQILGMKPQD